MSIYEKMMEAVAYINSRITLVPEVGAVLGSGLGDFADTLTEKTLIPYDEIPHFKKVSVKGHAGRLVVGKINGKPAAVLQGRYHFYEGHHISDVVFPIRVLCGLGVKAILLTNAAGGINSMLNAGDLMIIADHINMMGKNPLTGDNDSRLGTRFPDMSHIYDKEMSRIIAQSMAGLGLGVKKGVYAAMSGPSYETPAEIRMLGAMGADAVGMSTVPEAIAARHMGCLVAGISCVSNLAAGISKTPLNHKEVTETADRVNSKFIELLSTVLPTF